MEGRRQKRAVWARRPWGRFAASPSGYAPLHPCPIQNRRRPIAERGHRLRPMGAGRRTVSRSSPGTALEDAGGESRSAMNRRAGPPRPRPVHRPDDIGDRGPAPRSVVHGDRIRIAEGRAANAGPPKMKRPATVAGGRQRDGAEEPGLLRLFRDIPLRKAVATMGEVAQAWRAAPFRPHAGEERDIGRCRSLPPVARTART